MFMPHLDKSTKIELIIFVVMLFVSYLVATFISFDIIWFIKCTAIARGVFLFGWVASSILIIYVTETK